MPIILCTHESDVQSPGAPAICREICAAGATLALYYDVTVNMLIHRLDEHEG